MNKFKVGDELVCVDNSGLGEDLSIGEIYTVKGTDEYNVWINANDSNNFGWGANRFKLVEENDCYNCKHDDSDPDKQPCKKCISDWVDNNNRGSTGWETIEHLNRLLIVTKIIHNGTTTITQFSDGSKMVARLSADDVNKYDPYVGWCVGVTAKLFGGKEKAKKFYKAHAVVQKAPTPVGPEPIHCCSMCKAGRTPFAAGDCKKCWQDYNTFGAHTQFTPKDDPAPVEQPEMVEPVKAKVEPEVILLSLKRKLYDDSVSKRHCYVCEGYHSLSNFAPCKGCWEAGNAGHHPNFQPKPFEE